ncbi:MAG: toxin co-regulated pilus biosynthesis Q family protein [Alphaproteobacteria bacterium]|nr:toxin co-regulated pilus biosynthesis Q family protein [Alphaproteobacteria bacterium]
MRKEFLLSFCLMCTCSICACSSTSNNEGKNASYDYTVIEEEAVSINTASAPNEAYLAGQCGANGVSCNDTPLINYTKTEADYRAYGERTKRDHLYTQASAGNNLTATIRPGIEEDVVTEAIVSEKKKIQKPVLDDGVFAQTTVQKVEEPVTLSKPEVKHADNIIKLDTPDSSKDNRKEPSYEVVCTDPNCTEVQKIKKTIGEDGSVYEIICDEECDDVMSDDTFSSEFTEESFDIADYVKDDDSDEAIEFKEIGKTITADVDLKEIKIDDNVILTWDAEEGDNLRELLTKWSAMSGWKLLWNTNRNYVLNAGVMFKGKFVDVSSALIRAFARARPAPIATFYKGNRVIVVETMENENAY